MLGRRLVLQAVRQRQQQCGRGGVCVVSLSWQSRSMCFHSNGALLDKLSGKNYFLRRGSATRPSPATPPSPITTTAPKASGDVNKPVESSKHSAAAQGTPAVSEPLPSPATPASAAAGESSKDAASWNAISERREKPAGSNGATSTVAAAADDHEEATPPPPPPPPPKAESGIQRLFASWQQGVVASIGAVMGIGFIMYLLYTPVKEDTVHHTAVVASEALGDIRLKGKALQLSKGIVVDILQDDKSLQLVVELVRKLLAQEDTKVAISSLLQSLFEDHYTQEVTKKFVLVIVRDPWIMDQLQVIAKEQVMRLLNDSDVQNALSNFITTSVTTSLEKPELVNGTARAVRRSFITFVNPWG